MGGAIGFASDYDGTLDLHHGAGITVQDRAAIASFREQGGLFGMNTGRTKRRLYPKLHGKVDIDFAVLLSGALILDGDGEVIWERRLPRDAMSDVVKDCRMKALGLYLVAGTEYWTTSPVTLLRRARSMINVVHKLSEIPDPIYGVAFRMLTLNGAARLAEHINETYADVLCAHQNEHSVDVTPAGCSKASGLEIVRNELGISTLGAIGDSYNDIPIMEEADIGYTFHTAPKALREAADAVVPTVSAALEDFLDRTR